MARIRHRSTLPMLETMVEHGPMFRLSTDFQYLGDTERTFLAARIGGGITDLYMNALGYTWRANAACLSSVLRSDLEHADGCIASQSDSFICAPQPNGRNQAAHWPSLAAEAA